MRIWTVSVWEGFFLKSKKKTLWLVIALAVFVVLAVFVYRCVMTGEKYRQQLEYSYARSLGELTEYLGDMQNALDKAKYVATATGQAGVAAKLREAGGGAKGAMSCLPFGAEQSEQIEKSISILSDFALYVGNKSARGEALSPDDYEMFTVLAGHVEKIGDSFTEIRQAASDGKISVGKTQRLLSKSLNLPGLPGVDDGLSDLSKELSALPTLLYDGPFSDHVEKREPEFLKGKEEIDGDAAVQKAAEFLKAEPSALTLEGESAGPLAAYEIAGPDSRIRITKRGGAVLFYKKTLAVETAQLGYEQALEKARQLLEEAGFGPMKECYYVINDNICTINFAAVQEDVVLYPDLVKVSIELAEGGAVELGATGYLMNHRSRSQLVPEVDENDAAQSLSGRLTIRQTAVALVPTAGEGENLCYEFTCTDKQAPAQEVLVYINGTTGLEEQIYIVTQSSDGKRVS